MFLPEMHGTFSKLIMRLEKEVFPGQSFSGKLGKCLNMESPASS